MNVKRLIVVLALPGILVGCSSGKEHKESARSSSTPSVAPTTSSASSASSSPTSSPEATSSTPAASTPTSTGSPTFVPTPDVGDPCSLLPSSLITSALGVKSEGGTPNSRAQFTGCNYSLTGSSGSGELILYLSTGRGPQIYNATQSGGGFTDVPGVGAQAAYNSEDGRFIARTDKDFVELTLPYNLKGATSDSPAGAKKAGTTLANKVLSSIS